jgi:hypothetical protein
MNKRFGVCGLVILLLLAAGCRAGAVEAERPYDNALGEIMYLVPADISLVEDHFHPDELRAVAPHRVGATSYWERIELQQARGELRALIVHHAAVDLVDETAVAQWYRDENLVLVGMGTSRAQFEKMAGRTFRVDYFWVEFTGDPHNFVVAFECRTHNGSSRGLSQDSIHHGGMLWFLQFVEIQLALSCH